MLTFSIDWKLIGGIAEVVPTRLSYFRAEQWKWLFLLEFHRSLFPRVLWTVTQYWVKLRFDTKLATSHYLNQRWPCLLTHLCVSGVGDFLMKRNCIYWTSSSRKSIIDMYFDFGEKRKCTDTLVNDHWKDYKWHIFHKILSIFVDLSICNNDQIILESAKIICVLLTLWWSVNFANFVHFQHQATIQKICSLFTSYCDLISVDFTHITQCDRPTICRHLFWNAIPWRRGGGGGGHSSVFFQVSLKFVPLCPISKVSLVQVMAWRRLTQETMIT